MENEVSKPKPYKLHSRWKIRGIVTTVSPLHIGSGETTTHPQLINKATKQLSRVSAIERNFARMPIIPGSALKGVLRSWAKRYFSNCTNAILRIFGDDDVAKKESRAGFAEFCNSTLLQPTELNAFASTLPYWRSEELTGILSHVCINRDSGTADEGKLYFEEFVPEHVSFDLAIFSERLDETDIRLLLAILKYGFSHDTDPIQLGANGPNGWGKVSLNFDQVEVLRTDPGNAQYDSASMSFRQIWNTVELVTLDPLPTPSAQHGILTIPISLKCRGPFLVNDTSHTQRTKGDDLPNFVPLRRTDGGAWLPASSFRGVLRQRAEFILRSIDSTATGLVEQVFGTTGLASRFTIEEFSGSSFIKTGGENGPQKLQLQLIS